MRDKGKRLLGYVRRHITGVGIAAVVMAMAFTVVRGMAGQGTGFDPGEIDPSASMDWSGTGGRTGYDLSGEGEDSEEISSGAEEEPEQERPEEESPKPEESGLLSEQRESRVVLPEGAADGIAPSETVGASETVSVSGSKDRYHKPENKEPLPGQEEKPGLPDGEKPVLPDEKPPGSDNEENTGKFSVMVDGKEHTFRTEDEALIWFAEHGGTKEENGDKKYFEGFVKDESGNLIPSYGDQDNFHFNEGTGTAYDYTGSSSIFVVPSGLKSLELGAAFKDNEKITAIVVPQSVEEIVPGGTLPALEKFIVSGTNRNFVSVDGVLYQRTEGGLLLRQMPAAKKTVEKWPEEPLIVGGYAFQGSKMERLELPETVTQIEEMAFEDSLIRTIVLPESVRSLGSYAFTFRSPAEGEEAARRSIIVKGQTPPSVTNDTFIWMDYNLSSKQGEPVTEILVPDSPDDRVYEAYLLTWGSALMRTYGGEAGLKILKTEGGAQNRYAYCEEGEKSGYKRTEGGEWFYWKDQAGVYRADEDGGTVLIQCLSASSMADLSASAVTSIEKGAFDGCASMTAVRLPESLKTMPEDLFADREGLKVIISYAPEPPSAGLKAPSGCVVCVRPAALARYEAAWAGRVRKILGTSEIYTATKTGLVFDKSNTRLLDVPPDMSSLSVPSYVTEIYEGAAAGSAALTGVTMPAKVTKVGAGAFADCTALRSVTWQTQAPVPESCFAGCTALTAFGASGNGHQLQAIEKRAFYGCTSLGTVLYYSYSSGGGNWIYYYALERIGEEAFSGCTSMTYAFLYSSVTEVGARAFGESGLESLYWYSPAPVPEACMKGCRALKNTGWGAAAGAGSIPSVGDEAFYGTVSLTGLYLPESVTLIGPEAFGGREGSVLTVTFYSGEPPEWNRTALPEGLLLYVPDSADEAVYQKYLEAWKGWLGDAPEQVLKTKDRAEAPAERTGTQGQTADSEGAEESGPDKPDTETEVPEKEEESGRDKPDAEETEPEDEEAAGSDKPDTETEVPEEEEESGRDKPDAEETEPEDEEAAGSDKPDTKTEVPKEEEESGPNKPDAKETEPQEEEAVRPDTPDAPSKEAAALLESPVSEQENAEETDMKTEFQGGAGRQ